VLTWASQPGRRYQVEEASELLGSWRTLPGETTATGQAASFLLPTPTGDHGQRFYRVRVLD